MRRGLAAGAAVCALVLAAGTVSAGGTTTRRLPRNDFRIVLYQRIGPYRDYLHGRFPASVRAFGGPGARGTEYRSNVCTVRWGRLGLDMDFVVGPQPCAAAQLARAGWYGATVHTRRWVVDRGLRVGDSLARLRRLYPKARLHDTPPSPPTWTLASVPGDGGPHDVLTATVWGGRVTEISVHTGVVF